jgi:hypothetical protein
MGSEVQGMASRACLVGQIPLKEPFRKAEQPRAIRFGTCGDIARTRQRRFDVCVKLRGLSGGDP